jgi:hypothetical protein
MSIVNLILALALMGIAWVATVRALEASLRHTDGHAAQTLPAAEAVPRRSSPPNRMVSAGTRTGPSNAYGVVDIAGLEELSA